MSISNGLRRAYGSLIVNLMKKTQHIEKNIFMQNMIIEVCVFC